MSQSNEKEKQNSKTDDEERSLQVVRTFGWGILMLGFMVVLIGLLLAFSPEPIGFAVLLSSLLGVAAVFTYSAISTMRKSMLERFREIDELKKEVQELKTFLTQK